MCNAPKTILKLEKSLQQDEIFFVWTEGFQWNRHTKYAIVILGLLFKDIVSPLTRHHFGGSLKMQLLATLEANRQFWYIIPLQASKFCEIPLVNVAVPWLLHKRIANENKIRYLCSYQQYYGIHQVTSNRFILPRVLALCHLCYYGFLWFSCVHASWLTKGILLVVYIWPNVLKLRYMNYFCFIFDSSMGVSHAHPKSSTVAPYNKLLHICSRWSGQNRIIKAVIAKKSGQISHAQLRKLCALFWIRNPEQRVEGHCDRLINHLKKLSRNLYQRTAIQATKILQAMKGPSAIELTRKTSRNPRGELDLRS